MLRRLTSSTDAPPRSASMTAKMRRSLGLSSSTGSRISARAGGRCSSERSALLKAASKLRSIAITSPVDFIWVPERRSASGNLSNGQRGILTTQ